MSVRALRRGSLAAARRSAVTYTIYPSVDGRVMSSTNSYANARSGAPSDLSATSTATEVDVGQQFFSGTYYLYEAFFSFDTSVVQGTIQSVTLSMYGQTDASNTDFTVEARLRDFGPTVGIDDWVPGADLDGLPLLASLTTVGFTTSAYMDFVSEAAFAANINQAGFTRMVLASSRLRAGSAPGSNEFVRFYETSQTGTDKDPKLVIVAG